MTQRAKRLPGHFLPRHFRLYCLGDGKTGTTTLARKFGRYRSAHERDALRFIPVFTEQLNGTLTEAAARSEIRRRSWRFNLEVDSAYFLSPFAGVIAELYDDARFVLMIRDCFSWLDSRVEWLVVGSGPKGVGVASVAARYGRCRDQPRPEEAGLIDAGLQPIASYFRYWSELSELVMQSVPPDRLCVVRLEDLDRSNERLASFVGVDPSTILPAHENRNDSRVGVLRGVPPEFVVERAQEFCAPLMQRFWGDDWTSLVDRLPVQER